MPDLPAEFIERMKSQLGDEASAFFDSLEEPSPTSIRLHPRKGKAPFPTEGTVPWCANGFYLKERPSFHLDPHWHGGAYYVQEASSMILDFVLSQINLPDHPRIWLDLCAAPGGKTGILAKHLRTTDVLVANEVVHQRRSILRENLVKAGFQNTFISGEPASAFKTTFADIILVDAPCAGEGMMRKEPEAIRQWSPSLVQSCSVMQQKIVLEVAQALQPNGILIYSTCSYSLEENIENIRRFLDAGNLEQQLISFPSDWKIQIIQSKGATGYQLFPHRVKGEGLFVSVLRKVDAHEKRRYAHQKKISISEPVPDSLAQHVSNASDLRVIKNQMTHLVFPKEAEEKITEVLRLFPKAELISDAGEQKGKDFIPSHFLAMSGLYHPSTPDIELDYSSSLDYLERQINSLPPGKMYGWHVVRYEGTDLGWAKNTPQGWKNHYPMNWRLRDRRPRKPDIPQ